ncbi:hypothetical protein ACTWP5_00150 [Streptomyces sp. 4N509B]|uniref:hypothetical protein n=1 Tax=Streptomyces sp. 4N509B TaxID=3457413 RepID=UPI003FD478B6
MTDDTPTDAPAGTPDGTPPPDGRRAFDVRHVIAALLALYGAVLTATALAGEDEEHINLLSGLGMLAVAALMTAWALLRPVGR